MSIIVVCTKCRKSFKVSDKFAGKSGPCPNCKQTLQVPAKGEEVKIHTPEAFAGGGKTTTGKLIIKPIERTDAKFQPLFVTIVAVAVVVVAVTTWAAGRTKLFDGTTGLILAAAGLLAVSLPLVIAAYGILRDDELEPFTGRSLYLRSAICGAVYAALWGAFSLAVLPLLTGDVWNWVFVVPPFVLVGAVTAYATLNLEFGNAALHYGFFVLVTILLRWVAGMPWPWLKG
ncbi:MAG: hypothetical protein ABFC63_00615 [Thermoguttaceae bacterium]